jgi:hypothetical protein
MKCQRATPQDSMLAMKPLFGVFWHVTARHSLRHFDVTFSWKNRNNKRGMISMNAVEKKS